MKQIKVSDLEGEQAAEWAARARDWEVLWIDYKDERKLRVSILGDMVEGIGADNYRPDINSAQAMELMEEFNIEVCEGFPTTQGLQRKAIAPYGKYKIEQYGYDSKIAITRAAIASVYGETVTVEEE